VLNTLETVKYFKKYNNNLLKFKTVEKWKTKFFISIQKHVKPVVGAASA